MPKLVPELHNLLRTSLSIFPNVNINTHTIIADRKFEHTINSSPVLVVDLVLDL